MHDSDSKYLVSITLSVLLNTQTCTKIIFKKYKLWLPRNLENETQNV